MCPDCGHRLSAKDLIPLFSWLALKGKCRYCQRPISTQYPLVELLSGLLFAWSYAAWEFNGPVAQTEFGFWLVALTGLIILTVYDLYWTLLPDKVMKPLLGLALLQVLVVWLVSGDPELLTSPLLAALAAGGFFYLLHIAGRGRWMGGGDVKLAVLMGLLLGGVNALAALLIGFNAAALVSLVLLATGRVNRKTLIPFGPFLIGATVVAQLHGEELTNWYLHLLGL